ncbi:MAG: response regulator transcription factor [Bacteroidales bacterium]|nr:response regulator transcription factor [Bacteroidales bacterium]MDD4684208.1 response regulator transcription factor [Bacteroidales bacterium]
MRTVKLLLAESDMNLGPILKTYFDKNGFPTILVTDGESALKIYSSEEIDFVILETSLQVMDGFTAAEAIRELDATIPILFISEKHQAQTDIIKGFEIGADDYLRKPFSMEEILCRIKAISRRAIGDRPEDNIFKIGDYYTFDYNRHVITFKGNSEFKAEEIRLTGKESELLKVFALSMNQTVDRKVILEKVWKNDTYFNARSMDVYITKLRKYLRYDSDVKLANQHGVGFKLTIQPQSFGMKIKK